MSPAPRVTHTLAFTLTDIAPRMCIVRLSNGPTFSFRIELCEGRRDSAADKIPERTAQLVRILFPFLK